MRPGRRRCGAGIARVLLVSLAFLSAAGFLGLHALATPGCCSTRRTPGFMLATPVGVALGSVFAVLSEPRPVRRAGGRGGAVGRWLRAGLLALMALWAVASLLRLPPLHDAAVPESADGMLGRARRTRHRAVRRRGRALSAALVGAARR